MLICLFLPLMNPHIIPLQASDLGNLIGLYTQWHSHLLPYYSFDQFAQKVEQVGASRRVRVCLVS